MLYRKTGNIQKPSYLEISLQNMNADQFIKFGESPLTILSHLIKKTYFNNMVSNGRPEIVTITSFW